MNDTAARAIFSVLCLLAVVAVAAGGVLEVLRQQRGESLLRPGQFRLRIFSAFIWIIILGSLSFAVSYLWPYDRESARNFLAVVSGAMSLLVIALFLLAYDVWQVGKQRRASEQKINQQLESMAQLEIQKMQQEKNQAEQQSSEPGRVSHIPSDISGGQ